MKRTILSALAGAAAIAILPAGASEPEGFELRYERAELATDAGAAGVYTRIAKLAVEVCNDRYGRQSIVKYRAAHDRCEAEIIESLVNEVRDPRLSYIHAAGADEV